MSIGTDGMSAGTGLASRASKKRVTRRVRIASTMTGGLMLASMLDILMAILFFLLMNYSSSVSEFAIGKDISLPASSAVVPPKSALQLVVTHHDILLDNERVGGILNGDIDPKDLNKDGLSINPLFLALKKHKERSMFVQNSADPNSFAGTIILQADKTLQFGVLKKIIYTAGVADFVMLKLAVLKKDS